MSSRPTAGAAPKWLKDEPLFPTGGGGNVAFFSGLKWTYLGFGVSEGVKFFLLSTLDPLGPTWGAARAEKYLHPSGTPPQVSGPKNGLKSAFWVRGTGPA